jgi:hypothetical protein
MGAIHFSIDKELAKILASNLKIDAFVETGTFSGDSVSLVRLLFKEIHTCELSIELYRKACEKFKNDSSIHCHHGSSSELLAKIAKELSGKAILYWLDAHWCSADHTAGAESQCPLLEELDAIEPLHEDSVVWIDDARYFMSPPTKPLVMKGWPRFHNVQTKLLRLGGNTHRMTFANDTILLYPNILDDIITDYLYKNGVDWLAITHDAIVVLPQMKKAKEAFESEYLKIKNRE